MGGTLILYAYQERMDMSRPAAIAIIVLVGLASSTTAQVVTATENNPLIFGNVYAGVPKVIAKNSAGAAAEYFISGPAPCVIPALLLYLLANTGISTWIPVFYLCIQYKNRNDN